MISIDKLIQQLNQCKDTSITLPKTNECDFVQRTAFDIRKAELELLNKKGEVKGSYDTANELDYYQFPLLAPGEYLFRYIRDENGNKKWDTGNYLLKTYPEKVLYLNVPLELRANWELNETFILK